MWLAWFGAEVDVSVDDGLASQQPQPPPPHQAATDGRRDA